MSTRKLFAALARFHRAPDCNRVFRSSQWRRSWAGPSGSEPLRVPPSATPAVVVRHVVPVIPVEPHPRGRLPWRRLLHVESPPPFASISADQHYADRAAAQSALRRHLAVHQGEKPRNQPPSPPSCRLTGVQRRILSVTPAPRVQPTRRAGRPTGARVEASSEPDWNHFIAAAQCR